MPESSSSFESESDHSASTEQLSVIEQQTTSEQSIAPELPALKEIYRIEAERGGSGAGAAAYSGRLKNLDSSIVESSMGCGDPILFAGIRGGESILDIGCGMGLDSLLAAQNSGSEGFVVGLDYVPELLVRALKNTENKEKSDRLVFVSSDAGNLPFADNSFDLVLSNAVFHLLPDKDAAFREIERVLNPDGRLVFSDLATSESLQQVLKDEFVSTGGRFVFGAFPSKTELAASLFDAGFGEVELRLQLRTPYRERLEGHFKAWPADPEKQQQLIEAVGDNALWSVTISAEKKPRSWQSMELPCTCGEWVAVRAAPSVNVTDKPHFSELLRRGNLNSAKCENCGNIIESPVQFIYHDMEGHDLFVVFPAMMAGMESEIADGFKHFVEEKKKSGEISEDYRTGAVFGVEDLRKLVFED